MQLDFRAQCGASGRRRFVCLGFPKVSVLAGRTPCSCEVVNDPDGILSLLGRYWRLHRDALCSELDSSPVGLGYSELRRIRDFYKSEIFGGFPGRRASEKLEALFGRLRRVYVETKRDVDLIAFYDSPETTFFVPDVVKSRNPFIALSLSHIRGVCESSDNLISFSDEAFILLSGRKIKTA